MTKTARIRVLIADDHPIVRAGLKALINRRPDMTVVAEAADGREAVELFQQHQPDITLMDLRMLKMGGIEAIQEIRRQHPTARIIVFTAYDDDEDIYRGLQAGAQAYILKDTPRQGLLDCIRTVAEGKTHLSSAVAAKLAERLKMEALTPRELETLQLMSAGKNNKEIAAALSVVEGTVKVHVNNILEKLHVNNRTEAVAVAVKRGLIQIR